MEVQYGEFIFSSGKLEDAYTSLIRRTFTDGDELVEHIQRLFQQLSYITRDVQFDFDQFVNIVQRLHIAWARFQFESADKNQDGHLSDFEKALNLKGFERIWNELNINSKLSNKQRKKAFKMCTTYTNQAVNIAVNKRNADTVEEIAFYTVLVNTVVTLQLLPTIYTLLESGPKSLSFPGSMTRKNRRNEDFDYGFCILFAPEKCKQTCDQNAQCILKEGNYACECKEGFMGNGLECKEEENPCLNGNNKCGEHSKCKWDDISKNISRIGYICECLPGYMKRGLAGGLYGISEAYIYSKCYDIDECENGKNQVGF